MIDFETWDKLEKLLRQEDWADHEQTVLAAQSLLEGLLAGQAGQVEWREAFERFCQRKDGLSIVAAPVGDEALLSTLLQSCDIYTLERLAETNRAFPSLYQRIEQVYHEKYGNGIASVSHKTFYALLLEYIEKQGYRSEAEFYNKLGMNRQTFAKYRAYSPEKERLPQRNYVLWIVVGLGLDEVNARRLMAAAGYSFIERDKREGIILERIRQGPYTLEEIENLLYMLKLPPL